MARTPRSSLAKGRIFLSNFDLGKNHNNKKFLIDEIKMVKKHFGLRKCSFEMEFYDFKSSMIPMLKKAGFTIKAHMLAARVDDVHAKIVKRNFSSLLKEYQVKIGVREEDFDDVINFEFKAHRSDPSSLVHKYKRSDLADSTKRVFPIIVREQGLVSLYHDGKKAGQLLFRPMEGRSDLCFIATIGVHKDHQRKGLALLLYKLAVEEMKKKKLKHFIGFSSSIGVLKNAKKLGRTPISVVYSGSF